MAKKLTAKQVFALGKTMRTAMRKLLNDKMDYGSDSNVKMSVQAIVDTGKRLQFAAMTRRARR